MSEVFVPETGSAYRRGIIQGEISPWIDRNLLSRAAAENKLPAMFGTAWLRLNACGEILSSVGAICMLYVNIWLGIGLMIFSLFVSMHMSSKWTARLGFLGAVDVDFYLWATQRGLLAAMPVPQAEQAERGKFCSSVVYNLDVSINQWPPSKSLFWVIACAVVTPAKLILGGLLCAKSWNLGWSLDGVLCGAFGLFFVFQSLVRLPTIFRR
jgi:hypothetical protein